MTLVNRIAHRWFMRDLGELAAVLEQGTVPPDFAAQIQERVCDWLTSHLVGVDLALRRTAQPHER